MGHVVTTSEALLTISASALRHRVDSGRWQRPCRGVIVQHNGPLSRLERLAVALASAPPGSALGGQTALEIDGMTGFVSDDIHVVIPAGGRLPSMPGLIVHRSTELSSADTHTRRGPRRTTPGRSAIDAASWQLNPRFARAIVIASIQQGLVNTRGLREALTRRGPCRHRGLVVESILDAAGGVQSLPERDFAELWRTLRLPPLSHQRKVKREDGSYFLDAHCEALGFGVEIHGGPHSAVAHWDADLNRANEIVARGERLLFFTSYATRHAKRQVAEQVVAMAPSRGWPGEIDLPALTLLEQRKRRKFRQEVRRS